MGHDTEESLTRKPSYRERLQAPTLQVPTLLEDFWYTRDRVKVGVSRAYVRASFAGVDPSSGRRTPRDNVVEENSIERERHVILISFQIVIHRLR